MYLSALIPLDGPLLQSGPRTLGLFLLQGLKGLGVRTPGVSPLKSSRECVGDLGRRRGGGGIESLVAKRGGPITEEEIQSIQGTSLFPFICVFTYF